MTASPISFQTRLRENTDQTPFSIALSPQGVVNDQGSIGVAKQAERRPNSKLFYLQENTYSSQSQILRDQMLYQWVDENQKIVFPKRLTPLERAMLKLDLEIYVENCHKENKPIKIQERIIATAKILRLRLLESVLDADSLVKKLKNHPLTYRKYEKLRTCSLGENLAPSQILECVRLKIAHRMGEYRASFSSIEEIETSLQRRGKVKREANQVVINHEQFCDAQKLEKELFGCLDPLCIDSLKRVFMRTKDEISPYTL